MFTSDDNFLVYFCLKFESLSFILFKFWNCLYIWGDLKICHPNFQVFVHFWSDILKKKDRLDLKKNTNRICKFLRITPPSKVDKKNRKNNPPLQNTKKCLKGGVIYSDTP